MKTYFTKTKNLRVLVVSFCSLLLMMSCSNEEFDSQDFTENSTDEELQSKATPIVGKTYTIRGVQSGRTLDINNRSNNNGANLQLWGTDVNTTGTHRQWEILSVGDGYVRLRGVDSGKSLEVSGGNNSNGANVQQWTYQGTTHQQWEIISVGGGNFRLKNRDSGKSLRATGTSNGSNVQQWAYNGWDSQKWFFTEVGGSGNPPPPPGGGSAAAIIGANGASWKFNGYKGSLDVSKSDNGLDYVDNASKADNPNWLFASNGYAAFRTYPGNPTSGGSSNPRSELRELTPGGANADWDGTNNTDHRMRFRFRVDDLPPSGKLAFAQIHEYNDTIDDVIRVQVQGSSGQNSGSVDLRILGYVSEELLGSGQTVDFNMQMDTEYFFELSMKNKIVRLYELNSNGTRKGSALWTSGAVNAKRNYFKAGCYLQSTKSSHKSSSVYGQVLMKNIRVFH